MYERFEGGVCVCPNPGPSSLAPVYTPPPRSSLRLNSPAKHQKNPTQTETLEGERTAHAAQRGAMTAALKALGETVAEHQRGLREALSDATNAIVAAPGAGAAVGGPAGTGATPILSRLSLAGGRLSSIAKTRLSAAVGAGAGGSGVAVPAAVEENKPVV